MFVAIISQRVWGALHSRLFWQIPQLSLLGQRVLTCVASVAILFSSSEPLVSRRGLPRAGGVMARGAVGEFRTRASRPAEVLKQRIKQAQQRFRRTFQRKAFLSEPDRSLSRFRKTSNGALITATLHGVPVEGAYDEVSAVPLLDGGSQEGVILSTRGSRNFEPSSMCGKSSMSSGSSGSRWTPPSIPELTNLEPRGFSTRFVRG